MDLFCNCVLHFLMFCIIVVLQVFSSCELAMDNEEWVVTMATIVLLIKTIWHVWDILK